MTQIIACTNSDGIVLATDSVATRFDSSGRRSHFTLKKLLRLGSHAAMVSAGAGIGGELGVSFQRFIRERSAAGIEEILGLAVPFLTDEYGKYLTRRSFHAHPDEAMQSEGPEEAAPLTGIYLIVAGYSFKDRHQPYRLQLLGNDEEGQCIRAYPAAPILVIPRSLSMERRLKAQHDGRVSHDQLLSLIESFLRKRSTEEEEVGPPFHFATITPAGVREVTKGEQEE
jgi:20S proteasome alpha/beta subunit